MRRRKKQRRIIPLPRTRADLEREFGQVWDVQQLAHDYIVTAFINGTVVVRRKADDIVGSLQHQVNPPLYFNFIPAPASD